MKLFLHLGMTAFLLLSFTSNSNAESYKFITAPTHSKQKTKEIYTPLINYLSKKTGKTIELIYPINFLDYINKMKRGEADITFDGPHFSSWRINNLKDRAIARLPGQIKIAVITKQEHSKLNKMKDLIAQKVCGFASPNLLTMAYLDHYPNPVQLPNMVPVKGGFKGLLKCLKSNKGKAAVLRDKLWNKIDKQGLKLISIPEKSYPDRTFTVSNKMDNATQDAIQQALISPDASQHIQGLLSTFKKQGLIKTNNNEYTGIDKLLSQVWSFRKR